MSKHDSVVPKNVCPQRRSLSYQEVCGDLPLPGRMANFAAGVICLHMFSIVMLKIT